MAKFISLFSGAGGLDSGLESAGWDCVYASDIDPVAVATLEANRRFVLGRNRRAFEHSVIERADIRTLAGAGMLSRLGLRRGDVPLMAGGPPCQSWSSAGNQKGFDDPRGRLVSDYLRLASEIDARWLIFENVRGLLTARGPDGVPGSALAGIRRELLRRGWQTRVELVNAADYGVPQRRIRLILIGFQTGDVPPIPEKTHSSEPGVDCQPWVSLNECLSRLSAIRSDEIIRPSGKLAFDLAGLEPGTGAKSAGKRETTRPGGHWGYKQGAFIADPSLPARTVTASSQQDWLKDAILGLRRFSPRECAAIQTFPEKWVFCGSRSDQYRLIGNAVPPRLALALGKALLSHVSQSQAHSSFRFSTLRPLPDRLQSAIHYTMREESRNGQSRRLAVSRKPGHSTARQSETSTF